ncbi:hypothetical protein [Pantoea agglomerans]|uniref:hypothetical protein n=1 Tax=Enterobacter agglomerans TaxID=549 RepID=UPI002F943AEE
MENNSRLTCKASNSPFKFMQGAMLSMVLLLTGYLYCNYVEAAPLQNAPAPSLFKEVKNDKAPEQIHDPRAHIIVYRIDEKNPATSKRVVNVFVNNQYYTSVMSGDRGTEISVCPGQKKLDVMFSQHDFVQPAKIEVPTPELKSGERYYYQLAVNDQQKITARLVPAKEAESVLTSLKAQSRTLSRVVNERSCSEAGESKLLNHPVASSLLNSDSSHAQSNAMKIADKSSKAHGAAYSLH